MDQRSNGSDGDYTQPLVVEIGNSLCLARVDRLVSPMVVMAAGITHFGTLAWCEFLTNPEQLEKLKAYDPQGEHKNMAIVLSTEVIKNSPGAPKIVAADFW